MAETFKFELVSPARLVLSEEVEEVVVPGADGDFAVLPGHAPFLSTIRPGFIDVKRAAGRERIFVPGGFADTNANGLTILAEETIPAERLTGETLDAAIAEAQSAADRVKDDTAITAAQLKVAQLKEIRANL